MFFFYFQFKINVRDLRLRTLSLTLWHQERLGRNVFLGEVMLNLNDLIDNQSVFRSPGPKWYDLSEKVIRFIQEFLNIEIVKELKIEIGQFFFLYFVVDFFF